MFYYQKRERRTHKVSLFYCREAKSREFAKCRLLLLEAPLNLFWPRLARALTKTRLKDFRPPLGSILHAWKCRRRAAGAPLGYFFFSRMYPLLLLLSSPRPAKHKYLILSSQLSETTILFSLSLLRIEKRTHSFNNLNKGQVETKLYCLR